MPMASATLKPGINTQRTLADNEAGVSQSQLIRYKDGLIQSYGGWTQYVSFTTPPFVRAMHAWQDAAGVDHLGVGATSGLSVITAGSNQTVTPQTAIVNSSATFSSTIGKTTIEISAPFSSGYPSFYNSIYLNTPVSVGGLVLSGGYQIDAFTSSIAFTITASAAAITTVNSSGYLPVFESSANSPSVVVTLPAHNYLAITGYFYPFIAPTSLTSVAIVQGDYQVSSVIDTSSFKINLTAAASAGVTATMNSSLVQIVYYVALGAGVSGTGFGAGPWGGGPWGGVGAAASQVSGTPITTTDWSMDNFGQVLLACPENGPVYAWSADSGLQNASVIPTAPFFNGGLFVSMPQQILVCWRSCQATGAQNNLIIRWSDAQDFTNWEESNATSAGSYQVPTGSVLMGGIQASNQGVLWTDIDCWVMQYVGGDLIFNFTKVGSGCGLIAKHACGILGGNVYWCGTTNFFSLSNAGVTPLPCTVWDYIFQNLNTTYQSKMCCAINTTFNEVAWFFCSIDGASTENDSYVKMNVLEQEWDYGRMVRTAWIDVSVLGKPIGVDTTGNLLQHETGNVLAGVSLPSFRTGWWSIADGNELAFVDFIIPDFRWGTWASAMNSQVILTFYFTDYPNDTPSVFGPFTISASNQYINLRARGRFMSVMVQTATPDSFFRLGRIRFRLGSSGRR